MQKARCHPPKRTPTFCTHHISGTISSPFRGAFHLSLTVLSAIDLCICLALEGGPPRFRPDYTCPTLLRILLPLLSFSSTGLSPSMAARSRVVRLKKEDRRMESYNPHNKLWVWAVPLSLATTWGISILISFPRLLRCFSSPSDLPVSPKCAS
jgi:hypothetical protein